MVAGPGLGPLFAGFTLVPPENQFIGLAIFIKRVISLAGYDRCVSDVAAATLARRIAAPERLLPGSGGKYCDGHYGAGEFFKTEPE